MVCFDSVMGILSLSLSVSAFVIYLFCGTLEILLFGMFFSLLGMLYNIRSRIKRFDGGSF